MNRTKRQYVNFLIWICAVVFFAVDLLFSYKAGCAGGTKSGSLESVQQALAYESYSFTCFLLGLVLSTIAAFIGAKQLGIAAARATVTFIVVLVLMLFAGMHVESWGMKACFLF